MYIRCNVYQYNNLHAKLLLKEDSNASGLLPDSKLNLKKKILKLLSFKYIL